MSQKIRIKRSELARMSEAELAQIANNANKIKEARKNKRADFYLERMTHVQEKMHKSNDRFVCVWAGNRCLRGDQKIITKDGLKEIRDIQENDQVASFDQVSNQLRYNRSSAAEIKGSDYLYRVVHEAGEFVAHPKHAIFSSQGEYLQVSDLKVGDELSLKFSLQHQGFLGQDQTTQEFAQLSSQLSVSSSTEISSNCEGDYQAYSDLYDQLPMTGLGQLQLSTAQQNGVIALEPLFSQNFSLLQIFCRKLKLKHIRLYLQKILSESLDGLYRVLGRVPFLGGQIFSKFPEQCVPSLQSNQIFHATNEFHPNISLQDLPSLHTSRVFSIEKLTEKQDYYDVQVNIDHNYIDEHGVIHHNSGKSTGGAMELRWRVLGDHPFKKVRVPIKAAMICTDFENHLKKVIEPKIMEWFPPSELEKATIERNQGKALKTIRFRNGSVIDFYSHDQDPMVLESSDYDFAWADEPLPHNLFKAIWRGLTDRGGHFLMTGTPIVQAWMIGEYKKWESGNPDGLSRLFVLGKTDDNAHNIGDGDVELGRKRIREFASMLSPEEKESRLNGMPLQLQGMVFPTWDRSIHITKPFAWPSNWPIIESIDPHPRKPAGYSLVGQAENGSKVLLYSGYLQGDVAELADEILIARGSLTIDGGRQPRIIRTLIDNSANAPLTGRSVTNNLSRDRVSTREELENIIGPRGAGGPRIECPRKDVMGKIDAMKAWLTVRERNGRKRPDFYVFDIPENEDFIQEIEGYVWARYKNKENSGYKDQPIKRNDDIIDSVMQVALTLKGHVNHRQEVARVWGKTETYTGRQQSRRFL